ncbi:hypothetical protein L0222_31185 [bacterium]|nr:hypothetical protein [bacterium]MCI0606383.1 hypothetical protein [bacterium]
MEKVLIREGANTMPSNEDTPLSGIDGSKLTAPEQFSNPRLNMVADPRIEDASQMTPASLESIQVLQDATGPDKIDPDKL